MGSKRFLTDDDRDAGAVRDALRQAVNERTVLTRHCPACGAEPGKPCVRVGGAYGSGRELVEPHRTRIEATS